MSTRQLRGTVGRENGAILPLVTILILVMFGFAALGVDASAAYAERRQAQSEADAAVMAGALVYLDASTATTDAVIAQVISFGTLNAPGTPPTPGDWDDCVDDDRPGDYSPLVQSSGATYDCISLKQVDSAPALLRVRTPDWDMPTSFAGLIGFDTVSISATATAELRYQSSLPLLPFSVPANPSIEECMATSPSGLLPGDTAPCGGPTQGNFGLLDSPWFGAPDPQFTNEDPCPTDPNFNTRAPHNLAYGLDHIITEWPDPLTVPAVGVNQPNNHPGADSCDNAQTGVVPYVLQTQTGNTQTAGGKALLRAGFLGDDADGAATTGTLPGRLRQPSSPGASGTRMNFVTNNWSFDVDNVGLWEYLIDPASGTDECNSSQFAPLEGRELTNQLLDCLDPPAGSTGTPIFDLDIIESPRFAVVPVLNYAAGEQFGTKWWAVLELRPVYLQSTWYDCTNGSDKECLFLPDDFANAVGFDPTDRDDYSILFNPGEAPVTQGPCYLSGGVCVTPLTSRFQLMGLSALVLEWDQIPGAENQLGGNAPFEVFLYPNE